MALPPPAPLLLRLLLLLGVLRPLWGNLGVYRRTGACRPGLGVGEEFGDEAFKGPDLGLLPESLQLVSPPFPFLPA